jgi:Amiloride-sensitive sodium channel
MIPFRIDSELQYERNLTFKSSNKLKIHQSYPIYINSSQNPELLIKIQRQTIPQSYQICRKISILAHSHDFLPTFSDRDDFHSIDYGLEVEVEVVPEIVRSDRNLRNLNADARKCYFDNEKTLKFFKIYSQKNCEIECFTNYTVDRCGCVALDQPYDYASGIKLCSFKYFGDDNCCERVRIEMLVEKSFSTEVNCSCYQTCDSVSYHTKYKYTKIKSNETTVSLRMNTEDAVLYRRYQQFTFSDTVSYVGGLLGLFAGISMLSIVEIFYFFSLRLCGSLCHYFHH